MDQSIIIDLPVRGTIRITAIQNGMTVAERDIRYDGPVDTQLLTAIDNLFKENILDKFASIHVSPGTGVDKSTLLYRIILTLGAALQRGR